MKKSNRNILLSILVLILGSFSVFSKDTDFSKWQCKSCPYDEGWYGDFTIGFNYVNENDLGFLNYRAFDDKGVFLALDAALHFRKPNGIYFDLYTSNLGLDNQKIQASGGRQGEYALRFSYNEIVKYRGRGSQTPFIGVGTNNLTLPNNWVFGTVTSELFELLNSLNSITLKTKRKTIDAGITLKSKSNWEYSFDYQNQKKNGIRPFSGGLFDFQTSIFPAPVDFNTDQINMKLTWHGKRSSIGFGFFSSFFSNNNQFITWQNPFSANEGSQNLRSSLEPDNKYYQVNLNGAFSLSPKFRLSGQASIGSTKQNDSFIPYSINPLYDNLVLPRLSLNGQLDTSSINLSSKINSRLSKKLTVTARAKLNKRDNKTPVDTYTPINTGVFQDEARNNRPYSYEKEKYTLDMRYRFNRKFRFNAGLKYQSLDRTLQEVDHMQENTVWAEIKITANDLVHLRLKIEDADRDVANYQQIDDGGPVDHPLFRKFNQADRERKRTQVQIDINPITSLDLNLNYFKSSNKYDDSFIGLQNSNAKSYSLNGNYVLNDKINFTSFVAVDSIDANIKNAESTTSIPWTANTEDEIFTKGIGLTATLNLKSSFGLDYISSRSKGNINVQTELNEAPFPTLRTDLTNIRLNYEYQINDKWGYIIHAENEKYTSTDWAFDDIGVNGIPNVLTLGTQSANYHAWIVRLQMNYQF